MPYLCQRKKKVHPVKNHLRKKSSSSSSEDASDTSTSQDTAETTEVETIHEDGDSTSNEELDYSLRGYEIGQTFEGETNVERLENANELSLSIRMNCMRMDIVC